MEIRIPKALHEALKYELVKKPFEIEEDACRYHDHETLDLREYDLASIETLRNLVGTQLEVRGAKTLHRDIITWIKANEPGSVISSRARTVKMACSLLIEHIRRLPNKHIYKREQAGSDGVVLPYYVEEIKYHPPETSRGYESPPYVQMDLFYFEFGVQKSTSYNFSTKECLGHTPAEMLHNATFMEETPALRGDYEYYLELYEQTHDAIGNQYLAVGVANTDGVDGNYDDEDRWNRNRGSNFVLDKDGEPARVLVDVFHESEKDSNRDKDAHCDTWFWSNQKNITYKKGKEPVWDPGEDGEEATVESSKLIDIPIHPYVIVFDLKRHKRMKIHVGNLTEYKYDKTIRERLILPKDNSQLIDTLLVEKTSHFKDVLVGKSGGTIIICQGPPGTGKTLTAEIYAEALERPLYTIQCSQLGIDSETLETNLMKVLARGRRWGAVMLLDEADVYVHRRGNDLMQNAIVGVFLRVLEYQSGVLFLTTNRGDLVDDAILSRCTARVEYGVPACEDQRKIWRVLATANSVELGEEMITSIVTVHSRLSGRDIKNLLKLAMLVSRDSGRPIDVETVTYVKRFKPTCDDFGDA